MFCAIFSNDRCWTSWNVKLLKIILASCKEYRDTKLLPFHWDFLPFHWDVLCFTFHYFSSWKPSWLVCFYLILKQLNKGIILTQIWSKLMAADVYLGLQNCKKSKWLHARNILAQNWINFNQGLRYCHFHVYTIFSNSPWWLSWIVHLHKFEQVYLLIKLKRSSLSNASSKYRLQSTGLEIFFQTNLSCRASAPKNYLALLLRSENEKT